MLLNLDSFSQQVNDFIYYLDDTTANKFFKSLKKEDFDLINSTPDNAKILIDLKFLLIPFLADKDVVDLFKKNLIDGLYLKEINLIERLKKRFIFLDIDDRDSAREGIKAALLASNNSIVGKVVVDGGKEIISASDWVKDYLSFTQDDQSALKKAQYLNARSGKLSEKEKNILKIFFDVYNFLDASSKSPEGFEDDILLKENGKLITTHKGAVVVLYDFNNPPKSKAVKKKSSSKKELSSQPGPSLEISKDSSSTEEQDIPVSPLSELEKILNNYSPSSLEYKAIQQEISRLKSAELRKAQKLDVKE